MLLLVASRTKRQRGTLRRRKYIYTQTNIHKHNLFRWHTHMRVIQMLADAISAFQIYTHGYCCLHCVRVCACTPLRVLSVRGLANSRQAEMNFLSLVCLYHKAIHTASLISWTRTRFNFGKKLKAYIEATLIRPTFTYTYTDDYI